MSYPSTPICDRGSPPHRFAAGRNFACAGGTPPLGNPRLGPALCGAGSVGE